MYNLTALFRINYLINQMAFELGILVLSEPRNPMKYKTLLTLLVQSANILEATAGAEVFTEKEAEAIAEDKIQKIISEHSINHIE